MITIPTAVLDIIQGNEIALESLRAGILNLSAYARQIQPEIEKKLIKRVPRGTIVTALSRLLPKLSDIHPLRPLVRIEDIGIKSPLVELCFDKSTETIKEINLFRNSISPDNSFFTVTQGFGEVTLIMPENLKTKALSAIKHRPKGQYDNLVAVTIRIVAADYIETPNMIYTLTAALAAQRINLIEIVSTYTEISFIVRQSDMKKTIDVFKDLFVD